MMKILLINPPFTNYGGLQGHGGMAPPLNLGYLAAYARSKNNTLEISILDTEVLGMRFEDIKEYIRNNRPDVIGITSSTPVFTCAINISRIAKEVGSDIKVIFGGVHPSALPDEVISYESVDFVVRGEGEVSFFNLLCAIENGSSFSGIDGISYKDNGKVVHNQPEKPVENLDELPFPARDLMPHELYKPPPTKRVSMFRPTSLTSARGCPYHCNFCSASVIWGSKYRYRSPENIVAEIEECIEKFNIREFSITDELFTISRERVVLFCEKVLSKKLNIAWVCMSRAGYVDKEMLEIMKKAGCREISFGLESGDEEMLARIHKQNTLEAARKSIHLVKEAGIKTHASFMIGNLGESENSIRKTIDFAKELNTDIAAFFIASPLPGTELYKDARRLSYIRSDAEWKDFSPLSKTKPVLQLPNLSPEDLQKWHRRAIKEYYLRPRYILKRIFSLKGRIDFLNLFDGVSLFMRIRHTK